MGTRNGEILQKSGEIWSAAVISFMSKGVYCVANDFAADIVGGGAAESATSTDHGDQACLSLRFDLRLRPG